MFLRRKLISYLNLQLEEGFNLVITEAANLLKENTENAKQVQESLQKFQLQVSKIKSNKKWGLLLSVLSLSFILWLFCHKFEFHSMGIGKILT